MKKINKIAVYSAIIFLASLGGCKKEFLEVSPTTAINAKEAFSTPATIAAALTGIYDISSIPDFKFNMMLNSDVKGGDALVVSGAANYGRFVSGYQFSEVNSTNEPNYYWTYGYRLIANTNQFELNIPTSPLSEADKKAYLAETRALRAETYFWLVQWFSKPYTLDPDAMGVPVQLMPLGPDDPSPARGKVRDTYAAILSDLLYAEANIPASRTNIYRVTKASIQGLLARVYLTMANYPEASKYAKLARAGKALAAASSFTSGYINPATDWIYAINSRTDDNSGFLTVNSFYDPTDNGYSSFRVTQAFLDQFAANDLRRPQFLIGGVPTTRAEGYLINKFNFVTTPAQNQVIIRVSEMYLIEAEAEAKQGVAHEPAAKLALQAVQARAIPGTGLSANTGQALIDEIWLERDKELFGEGFKYMDLQRTLRPVTRVAGPAGVSGYHWAIVNLPSGDNKRVLPIPIGELNANPVLKPQQNPGYAN